MDAVRQIVNGSLLNQVITLPKALQDTWVEITIVPAKKAVKTETLTREKLRSQLKGSHTESLSGAIPGSLDMTIDEIREERRLKYEHTD